MKNIVFFASDSKALSSINSIIHQANELGHNLFIMVADTTQLSYPHDKSKYTISSTCEGNVLYSNSLGISLPFKPDWLILARERWEPESSIILEFKNKFNCKVGLIEPNCSIINSVDGFLETKSKNRFVPFIDVFFDHSKFINNQRKLLGFHGNSVVVGNPKYDMNFEVEESTLDFVKQKYNVDLNKTQVLLFSLINNSRQNLFEEFKKYADNDKYQCFIKPYPGEPYNPQFSSQYFPNFCIPNVTPILNESDVWSMFNLCGIHVGSLSSIMHASYLLGKEVVELSDVVGMRKMFVDPTPILKSEKVGVEDDAYLWIRSLGIKTISDLKSLLDKKTIDNFSSNNSVVWDAVDENNIEKILLLFDDFNDFSAGKRIMEYIGNED